MSQQRMLLPPSCVLMTSYLTASLFPVFCDLTEEGEYLGARDFRFLSNLYRQPSFGTDHYKSYGGGGVGGGEFSSQRNFFSLSNSLYEFILGHGMNIF